MGGDVAVEVPDEAGGTDSGEEWSPESRTGAGNAGGHETGKSSSKQESFKFVRKVTSNIHALKIFSAQVPRGRRRAVKSLSSGENVK